MKSFRFSNFTIPFIAASITICGCSKKNHKDEFPKCPNNEKAHSILERREEHPVAIMSTEIGFLAETEDSIIDLIPVITKACNMGGDSNYTLHSMRENNNYYLYIYHKKSLDSFILNSKSNNPSHGVFAKISYSPSAKIACIDCNF